MPELKPAAVLQAEAAMQAEIDERFARARLEDEWIGRAQAALAAIRLLAAERSCAAQLWTIAIRKPAAPVTPLREPSESEKGT
jgi:hypothetical protein